MLGVLWYPVTAVSRVGQPHRHPSTTQYMQRMIGTYSRNASEPSYITDRKQ
jgi:hypothetical protein